MVHIPFFGIEFPEPRVLEIIPDVIVTFIKICSRLVDAVTDAVYPLDHDEMKAVVTMQRNSIPREFDRVIARQLQGKIKNNEQLSSELEDASYDYYRRLLRTSVAGATDEGHDEFMSKQLFGLPLQPSVLVAEEYAMQHPEVFQDTDDALMGMVEAAVDGQDAAWVQERGMALQQNMRQLHQRADTRHSALDEQQQELQKLHQNARTTMAQATHSTANAGLGLALGLLVFKGVGLGLSRIMKAIRKGKKQAAAGNRPSGPVSRQPRTSSASGTPAQPPPPAATARTQRGQSSTAQASRQAAPAASSSSSTQQRSSQQPAQQASAAPTQASTQQQQQQQQPAAQPSPAARRARPASRTR